MKILLITPFFNDPHRGVASAYKTARELSRHGLDVHVLTARSKDQPAEEKMGLITIHRSRDLFLPDPFNFNVMPNLWWRTWRLVRKEGPDVVIISKYVFFTTLAAPLLRLLGQPFVITTDTFPGLCWFSPFRLRDKAVKLYTLTLGRWLLNLANEVILLHENLVPTARRLRLRRARVIHNGVDEESFRRHAPPRDIQKRRDKRRDEVIVTYVGRLENVKGWDLVLRAAERLTTTHSNVRFLFVGNTEGKTLPRKDRIEFLGFRRDVPAILAATDINVLASYAEGLPNTVMEAMAASVPVVASDVGGVGCLVRDGETGLLFPPGDVDALVRSLNRLIGDKRMRHRLGAAGRERIRRHFRWKSIISEYEELFESLREG